MDIIIETGQQGIVLIRRKNFPHGWAIPGGFVDYGEALEEAARREAREETGLEVELLRQLHTYSDPARDPRQHTIATVFIARPTGPPPVAPVAADDAEDIGIFTKETLPQPLMFDHEKILADYFAAQRR